ncbi:hypothetical protein J5N97_028721 [Dioscorea zingiberensis]|uniref:Uncharacterized protein n=1 Tax=Dioscorea zingiberensis TaxID=325984 RepID=A0A9D5BZN6_9LILI|nr:hypothetical protein J5N97_028721 [Dioscorea zingiberensis]
MAELEESIKILSQHQVSASPPTSSFSLPLTFFDLAWLHAGPVHRLFFYSFPHSTSHFLSSSLPSLLSSLSLSLHLYPPLASHLSFSDHHPLLLLSSAVTLTIAESTANFHQLISDHPKPTSLFKPLIPSLDPNQRSLMALQVTLFPFHGLCLAIAVDHVACDGSSSMQFMKSLAAASLVGTPPVFDRSSVPDPSNTLYSTYLHHWNKAKLEQEPRKSSPDEDLLMATFTLGRDHIQKLKLDLHCSTFVASSAYVWVCMIKARAWPEDRTAHFICAVDCRARLRPPLSPAYFGNCLIPCFVELKVRELIGEDGVMAAAKAIKAKVEELGENGVLSGAEEMMEKLQVVLMEQPLSVSGSPKFRVYDTEFKDWGKPVKVEVASIQKTGSISMAESRDEDGGVEIGLALSLPLMHEFSSHFNAGLKFDSLQKTL